MLFCVYFFVAIRVSARLVLLKLPSGVTSARPQARLKLHHPTVTTNSISHVKLATITQVEERKRCGSGGQFYEPLSLKSGALFYFYFFKEFEN